MEDNQEHNSIDDDSYTTGGYSFPIMTILIVHIVLLVSIANITNTWGQIALFGVYLLIITLSFKTALSEKDFLNAKLMDTTLTRAIWIFNWLLMTIIPLMILIGLIVVRI